MNVKNGDGDGYHAGISASLTGNGTEVKVRQVVTY